MLAFDDIRLARSLANKPLKKLAYLKAYRGFKSHSPRFMYLKSLMV